MKRLHKFFALLTALAVMLAALGVAAYAVEPDPVDMSLTFSPETQLVVYVDGEWSAALSGVHGYGETVTLTAPELDGKSFSHWTADGSVVSYANPLKLTLNANTELFAVYAPSAPTAQPVAGFTSITRSTDGEQIVLQAIASGETAGFVYSTTATGDALVIGGTGVTNVAAVKLDDNITAIPQCALDRNNCYAYMITPDSADTVYHVRTYVTDGGEPAYGDVKDVKLSELNCGISLVANLEGFEPGTDDLLASLTAGMHTVTFDANGGVGATIIQAAPGGSVTLRANTFTREGYVFAAWSENENGGGTTYADGDTVTITEDLTLYAVWAVEAVPSDSQTVTVPVSGEDETVNVKVEIKDDVAAIKEADIDKVLEAEEVGTVTIDVSGLSEDVTGVVIPGAMVEQIADAVADEDSTADGLEVSLPTGAVSFDAEAVTAIAEQADGKDLTLNLEAVEVTELTSEQQEAVGELEVEVVLDAYLTAGGERISDFQGGSATVKVPYTLKEGQKAQGVIVWYVADDGVMTKVPAKYQDGYIIFTVTHFSNYVIAYDAELAKTCPKDETCPMAAFTDLDPTLWYHDGVHFCLANGMMNGVGDDLFDPTGTTSRAMIVTILYRLEGKPSVDGFENPFDDVAEGQWYTDAVIWAAENKIVEGYDGKFAPTDAITREQLATILYRYAQSKGQGFTGSWMFLLNYPDASEISSWADEAMHWCVMNGIINGKDGKLVPGGDASRAEAATMLMRYCTKTAE